MAARAKKCAPTTRRAMLAAAAAVGAPPRRHRGRGAKPVQCRSTRSAPLRAGIAEAATCRCDAARRGRYRLSSLHRRHLQPAAAAAIACDPRGHSNAVTCCRLQQRRDCCFTTSGCSCRNSRSLPLCRGCRCRIDRGSQSPPVGPLALPPSASHRPCRLARRPRLLSPAARRRGSPASSTPSAPRAAPRAP